MWNLVICVIVLLLICLFGPYLRNQYITKKCQKNNLLVGFKLKPIFELLEFIDWILQFFFRIRIYQLPKKKLIDEFSKTLDNSVLGNQQHLLLEGFVHYVEELDQIPMNLLNRISIQMELNDLIKTRQNVIACLKMHPTITSSRIRTPLIITGLPRTGTTMLYNLLDVDQSSFQSAKIWQMTHLINNPTPSQSKIKRQKTFQAYMEQVNNVSDEITPIFYSSHPPSTESFENEKPEEDMLILTHCFPMLACPYSEWMLNEKPAKAYYQYHYKYFTMLQLDNDNNNNNNNVSWLWKAPTHMLFIDSLLETYPDARLIITHRHPCEVIPSLGKLYATYLRTRRMPGTLSLKEIGRIAFNVSKRMINKMEVARFFVENNPNVVHLHYSDLVNNPINSIKRIYDHFHLSPIPTQLMEKFQLEAKQNPQQKYGRMKYDLDEFELTKNEIEREFATYINWLDTILISSKQS